MTTRITKFRLLPVFTTVALLATACGSSYTILDRSSLEVSPNSRISAKNLVPRAAEFPDVVDQLAIAQEVYQQQLLLLKERRNKLRGRKRTLSAASFGTFAATSVGIGTSAILSGETDAPDNLKTAGLVSLGGLALGTVFQIASFMQEDSSSVDAKVRHLELLYDTMIERLRQLTYRRDATSADNLPTSHAGADMATAIESFITQALAINIKG